MSEETTDTVVCCEGFASALGGAKIHEEFRSDDPLVLAYPRQFVAFGTPTSEFPSPFDRIIAASEQAEAEERDRRHAEAISAAKANRVMLDVGQVLRAVKDVVDVVEGRTVTRGSTVLSDDPLALRFPDAFKAGGGK